MQTHTARTHKNDFLCNKLFSRLFVSRIVGHCYFTTKRISVVIVLQANSLTSADTFFRICQSKYRILLLCTYLNFSSSAADVMTLQMLSSICSVHQIYLRSPYWSIESSEKIHSSVHFVDIEVLADVSKVLPLLQFKLDFRFYSWVRVQQQQSLAATIPIKVLLCCTFIKGLWLSHAVPLWF